MNQKHTRRLTGWGDYVTSTVSVTLVLFILGLTGLVNIAFGGINRQVREKMGFTMILNDSISQASVDSISRLIKGAPYVSTFSYMSAEDVLAEETGGEGDQLIEMLGVNPYSPMIEVKVKAAYAEIDSINPIIERWKSADEVSELTVNTELIDNLNRNANLINTILIIMAAALLLISFVLINNTVRLTVYARRFLIHTMKLVGATGGFIRRPFLISNALQGFIAALVADGLLALCVAWAHSLDMGLEGLVGGNVVWPILVILPVLGVLICDLAAIFATNRYLRQDYDSMFN